MDFSYLLLIKDILSGLYQVISYLSKKNYSKLEKDQFIRLASDSFDNVRKYLRRLGLKQNDFSPGNKQDYINSILDDTNEKDGFYFFRKGEIESFFFDKFNIPHENRFDIFAKYSYLFLEGYEQSFKYALFKERLIKLLTKKKTVFHYMSIPGWPNLKYNHLASEVKNIKQANPRSNDMVSYKSLSDIQEEIPRVSEAIDKTLKSGKISERTILNLASSEKILIVHKYSEGFGGVYQPQERKLNKLKEEIVELENSDDPEKENKIRAKNREKKELIENWVRAPVSKTLEEIGFQKLFNRMDGVYIYPLFMLPEKYHSNPGLYIDEVVFSRAEKLLKRMKQNKDLFATYKGGLKYVILAHVISLNEIAFLTKERELGISSPALYRLLFKGFLFRDSSEMSSIYINDVVRNVDILNLWDKDSKSAHYLKKHFEFIKQILWNYYNVEIYRPISMITLSDENIKDLCELLHENDDSLAVHHFRRLFKETVDFYKQLDGELELIKQSE